MEEDILAEFNGGILDGVSMKWPDAAKSLPAYISMGFILPSDSSLVGLDEKRKVIHHKYEALDCYETTLETDGQKRLRVIQSYFHRGSREETLPSINDLFSDP